MAQFQASNKYPFWLRSTVMLFGVVLFFMVLRYGRFILLPLAISILLALLLEPLCQMFEKLKIGRIASIILTMLIVTLIVAAIFWFLVNQLMQFAGQLPQAGYKLQLISNNLIEFFHNHFHISPDQQINFVKRHLQDIIEKGGQFITTILGTTRSVFTIVGLLPFFLFFMLYYKDMYSNFLHKIWEPDDDNQPSVETVVGDIQSVTRNYILGLMTVITILAILNGLGLWLIGMDHVLFFAVFAAMMAVIPYIGVIIGSIPAIIYAILFGSSPWLAVGVIAIIGSVQFLEGNFITPNVVGSRVRINPFMALIALIIGGGIWGIAGMILFVPYVGILKCILDEIEPLKPYGYLLGNKVKYPREEFN